MSGAKRWQRARLDPQTETAQETLVGSSLSSKMEDESEESRAVESGRAVESSREAQIIYIFGRMRGLPFRHLNLQRGKAAHYSSILDSLD